LAQAILSQAVWTHSSWLARCLPEGNHRISQRPHAMLRVASAVLGALGFQLLHFALEAPRSQAAWGWTLDVPSGLGFTCDEGSSIGGGAGTSASGFDCTVAPADGMECDVSTASVVCFQTATPEDTFVPTLVSSQGDPCLNVGHTPDAAENDDNSELMWSTVPTCTEVGTEGDGTASSASKVSAMCSAFAVSLFCV